MADRYTYLPLIGLFVIAAWGSAEVVRRYRGSANVATVAALLLIAAYAGLAWQQTRHWSDSIALFRHSLAVAPGPPALHNNLGNALAAEGRWEAAVRQYEIALSIYPDYARAHNNLGSALAKQGRLEPAIEHFRRALELEPDYGPARANLERALSMRGAGSPSE
jgi:tetratricopeptide (TPR) repeat protein